MMQYTCLKSITMEIKEYQIQEFTCISIYPDLGIKIRDMARLTDCHSTLITYSNSLGNPKMKCDIIALHFNKIISMNIWNNFLCISLFFSLLLKVTR